MARLLSSVGHAARMMEEMGDDWPGDFGGPATDYERDIRSLASEPEDGRPMSRQVRRRIERRSRKEPTA